MISLLRDLLSVFEAMGAYVAIGVVDTINAFFAVIELAVEAIFLVLPTMPSAGTFAPSWLGWLNWFYPIGSVVAAATTILLLYVGWLAVRYVLQLVRAA